jgi:PIN domain nuclease of toxin-antitoxin system
LALVGNGQLGPLHTDPFDRSLIAQSVVLDVPLLTGDAVLGAYAVPVIDARR